MSNPTVAAQQARIPEALRGTPAMIHTVSPLTVLIDGATHSAVSWMPYWQHFADDRVLILRGQGRVEIIGSKATRPTSAIVGSVADGRATVTDDTGRTISGLPYVGDAPAVSARVAITWGQDGGYISGVLSATVSTAPSTTTEDDPTPPGLPSSSTPGVVTAAAADSATARSGAWRTDGRTRDYVYQGHVDGGVAADNTGFWFYGRALVVPDATADDVGTIRLRRDSLAGMSAAVDVHLTLHAEHAKPGAPPATIAGPVTVGALRWGETSDPALPLPAGWAQQLLDGTAGGVGLTYAGTAHYGALFGPRVDPSAALISIPYSRES